MKIITLYEQEIGLVFRKNNFVKALTEGTHLLWFGEKLRTYNINEAFHPPVELNILLQDPTLEYMLEVLTVKDNELALVFKEGIFAEVLSAGRYAFWKGSINYDFQLYDLNELEIPAAIDRKLLIKSTLIPYIRIHIIQSYENGLLFVDGKFVKPLAPGTYYYWKNELSVSVLRADLRVQQMEVSGQEMLTKDKAALRINYFAQYQVVNIEKALVETNNYNKQLYVLIQLALRAYIGTLTLDELLAKKADVQTFVLDAIAAKALELGVKVSDNGIRDIILPGEVKTIMNQVLIAEKQAQANLITRREETASTRSLLNTAKLMEQNEMLFKLKEMEYVEKIAEKINSISISGSGQVVEQLKAIFAGD